MAAEDGDQLKVEEGMSWLPSHVLDEACDIKVYFRQKQQKITYNHRQRRFQDRRPPLMPSELTVPPHQRSKYILTSRPHPRQKSAAAAAPVNPTAGGHGMQAIFLDSGRGRLLGGTGVFLPRGAGTGYQPNRKPACATVLLPNRVVQALNLNVQALGLQVTPRKDLKKNQKGGECNSIVKNKPKGKNVSSTHCSFISQNHQTSSQEIFLPKEWTY